MAYRTPVTTVEHIHKAPKPEGTRLCPGYAGGVEWNGPALDPANQNLIVGAVDVCFIVKLECFKANIQAWRSRLGWKSCPARWSRHGLDHRR